VHIVREATGLEAALKDCASLDREILIEEFVEGRELTVGVVGDRALAIVEIRPHEGFYDYAHKYTKGASEYFCPAPLDAATTAAIQDAALRAHRSLGLEVYSRVDVLLRSDGSPFVLEANTIPGMTETSLLPKAAAAGGTGFLELCEEIASLSLRRFPSP
jgi:D-alanine-D-alanine ligase